MLIALLSLGLLSCAGVFVWVFNTETAAVVAGSAVGLHPLAVGLTCALGQALGYSVLYFGSHLVLRYWRWGRRKVEATQQRLGQRMGRGFFGLLGPAALLGIPPLSAMVALAPGLQVRYLPLISITLALRTVRFGVLAAFGQQVLAWWNGSS